MVHLLILGFSVDPSMGNVALLDEESDDAGLPLVISEFMALNGSKPPLTSGELLDEDGDSSDWIEIYNSTDTAISLNGWYLTDDANDLTRWELPNVQIDPGQYNIIFASGKDRDDPDGELHTNFQLVGSPGFLGLVRPVLQRGREFDVTRLRPSATLSTKPACSRGRIHPRHVFNSCSACEANTASTVLHLRVDIHPA